MQKKLYIWLGIALILYGFWSVNNQSNNPENVQKPNNLKQTVKLLAVGDINLGRLTGQKILEGNHDYAFEYISDYVKSFDIAFGNLESQLADLGGETQSPTNEYRFAGPPEGAESLRIGGWDIVSTANNHMWDYGKNALFETMENLEQAGIKYIGSRRRTQDLYQPVIIDCNNQRIAFLAGTMLLNGYEKSGALDHVAWADSEELTNAIKNITSDTDWVIVSLHGGIEYRATPIKEKVELAHQLIDAGADIVIGHHTHIPQGVEQYNDKLIFYSLGNFAFWQPFGYWTENSFAAEIYLGADGKMDYKSVAIDAGWQPKLVTGKDEVKILEHINELSNKLNS